MAAYRRGYIELVEGVGIYEWNDTDEQEILQCRFLDAERFHDEEDVGHHLSPKVPYLCIHASGLYDSYEYAGVFSEAMSRAKQFLYLSMQIPPYYDEILFAEGAVSTGVVVDKELGLESSAAFTLPPTIGKCVRPYGLAPWYDVDDGEFLEADSLSDEIRSYMGKMPALFQNSGEFETILTSCEWAFDSYFESNETISFIFLSIAFEALLGRDGSDLGLTTLLSDRLSMIAAKSHVDRSEIRSQFKRFYQTRSKVVHGRRAKLEAGERELLRWARQKFKEVLKKEMELPISC